MAENVTTSAAPVAGASSGTTRALLWCGIAGPFVLAVVAVIQAFIRPGFDVRRHEIALLSNGDLGWIQVANFIVTGALMIAGAAGMRQALRHRDGRGGTWGPLLIGIYGLSLIGAGTFAADPKYGFPPGAPAGVAPTVSFHALLHILIGVVGAIALFAACVVFAVQLARRRSWGWVAYTTVAGVYFLFGFVGIILSTGAVATIDVDISLLVVMTWTSALAASLLGAVRPCPAEPGAS